MASQEIRDKALEMLQKEGIIGGVPENEITPEQMDFTGRVMSAVASAGTGAALGMATGGPPGALVGGVAGLTGDVARQLVESKTGSELAGAGAGMATDLVTSLAMRRPSAGLSRRVVSAVAPKKRAARILAKGGLLGAVGPEGAEDVSSEVVRQYVALEDAENAAWSIARRTNSNIRVSSAPVKAAARDALERAKGLPKDEKSQAALAVFGKDEFGNPIIGDDIGVDDARLLLSRLSQDRLVAFGGEQRLRTRSVGTPQLRRAVEKILDDIASKSPSDSEAVTALREARAATARKFEIVPERSAVQRALLGPQAFDQPEKAMQTILSSRQPQQEVTRIKTLIRGNRHAERGLKRVAIQRIFGRVTGGTGEIAPRSVGAAANRAQAERKALEEILGKKGYQTVLKNSEKLYNASKGGSKKFLPEVRIARVRTPGHGGTIGTIIGYAFTQSPTGALVGGGIGGATQLVIDQIATRFGPNAARLIALEALIDDSVMKQVVKAASPEAGTTAERVIESLVRRGVLTFSDFAELEKKPASAGGS